LIDHVSWQPRGYQSHLAEEIGVSRSNISAIICGKQRPTVDQAFAIEELTDGAVPASSWARPVGGS